MFLILHLHQTTTMRFFLFLLMRCFLSCIYIKPQLLGVTTKSLKVVSYLASTSNHNAYTIQGYQCNVVSYLASTSNHNGCCVRAARRVVVSYLASTSNHNFTLGIKVNTQVVSYLASTSNHNGNLCINFGNSLFLILHLHQTTTASDGKRPAAGCFLSCIYIKPQREVVSTAAGTVVSYLASTSNHNFTFLYKLLF